MSSFAAFCKRKDIEISVQRYLIDALGAMAPRLVRLAANGHYSFDYRPAGWNRCIGSGG